MKLVKIGFVVVLGAINTTFAFLTMEGAPSTGRVASELTPALLGPLLLGALFCLPQSGRTTARYLTGVLVFQMFGILGKLPAVAKLADKTPQVVNSSDGSV